MKKINFTLLVFFILLAVLQQPVFAQVKIGANPTTINANSLLEMEQNTSTGRYGMRLPRVALDSTSSFAPLSAHVQGMTVYNTATAGTGFTAVSPGIYYNDGTKWIRASKESGVASGYVYYVTSTTSLSIPFLTQSNLLAGNGLIKYASNDGSDFNISTGQWTCPSSGVYSFEYQMACYTYYAYGVAQVVSNYLKNGINISPDGNTGQGYSYPAQGNNLTYKIIEYCNAGDVIEVKTAFYTNSTDATSSGRSLIITEITGNGVTSSSSGPNQVPNAQNVTITGNTLLYQTLTANFTYNDYEGNPQNGTTRQWYRADDASGTNETPIAGATNSTYTITTADTGKYIRVGVIPRSSVGASPGTEAFSAYAHSYPCGGSSTVTFTYRGASVTYGTLQSPVTGKCYLDRNLGANSVATSVADANGYGDSFQWGRPDDGHQDRASGITNTLATSDVPGHGNFIWVVNAYPYDWRLDNNNNRWVTNPQGPCPNGWHVPKQSEWASETGITAAGTAFIQLKLTVPGYRDLFSANLYSVGAAGYYWGSTVYSGDTRMSNILSFNASAANPNDAAMRAQGMSVRCIKD